MTFEFCGIFRKTVSRLQVISLVFSCSNLGRTFVRLFKSLTRLEFICSVRYEVGVHPIFFPGLQETCSPVETFDRSLFEPT